MENGHPYTLFQYSTVTYSPKPRCQRAALQDSPLEVLLRLGSIAGGSDSLVGPHGIDVAWFVSHEPLLLEECFPFTCMPPLVQAPAFQRPYLSAVEFREDVEVSDESLHLTCCFPEPVVVSRLRVLVQISQVYRTSFLRFVSFYPPGVVCPCNAVQREVFDFLNFCFLAVYRASHRVLDEFGQPCHAALGGFPGGSEYSDVIGEAYIA